MIDYRVQVGQLGIVAGAIDQPQAPSGLVLESVDEYQAGRASLRIRWQTSPSEVHSYNAYRRNPDGSETYLGTALGDALFVAVVDRVGNEPSAVIELEAIGHEFGRSSRVSASFDWQ